MEDVTLERTEVLVGEMLRFLDDDTKKKHQQQATNMNSNEDLEYEIENPICHAIKKILHRTEIQPNQKENTMEENCSGPVWNSIPNGLENATKTDKACRISNNNDPYIQEVNRAIFGSFENQPIHGSQEYYAAAENYALYGKEFHDFPRYPQVLIGQSELRNPPPEQQMVNYIPQTPVYPIMPDAAAQNYLNYGMLTSEAAGYFQSMNPVHQANKTHPNNYGMYPGNNITCYAAMAAPTHQQILLNQQQGAANFCSSINQSQAPTCSSAAAAAATAAAHPFYYTNPMLTTHYLNSFLKETHINTASLIQQQQYLSATGIYERLVYAQMLQQQQQQVQHQTRINQQQLAVTAAAVASMQKNKFDKYRIGSAMNTAAATCQQPAVSMLGNLYAPVSTVSRSMEGSKLSNANNEDVSATIVEE